MDQSFNNYINDLTDNNLYSNNYNYSQNQYSNNIDSDTYYNYTNNHYNNHENDNNENDNNENDNNENDNDKNDSDENDNINYNDINSIDFIIKSNKLNDSDKLKKLIPLLDICKINLEKINKEKKYMSTNIDKIKKAIIPLMEKHDVAFIDINKENGGGKIKYTKTKKYAPLTKKHTFNLLKNFFNNNEKQAKELLNFLYNNREFKNKVNITKTKK